LVNKRTLNALMKKGIKKIYAQKLIEKNLTISELKKISIEDLSKLLPSFSSSVVDDIFYKLRGQLSPDKLEQLNHIKEIRQIFRNSGFVRVKSVSDKQFIYQTRQGDFDDIFIYENVILLFEYTCADSSNISNHLLPKKILFDLVNNNKEDFIEFMKQTFISFKDELGSKYLLSQYELRILYCSKNYITLEHKIHFPNVVFLYYSIVQYFKSISNIIKTSIRYELFNFLNIKYYNIGERIIKGSKGGTDDFEGQFLPEAYSSFKQGYKVISFYIDAESLITR